MQAHARLTPGPGFQPLRAALYYAQRLITAPRYRRRIARLLAAAVNLKEPGFAPSEPGCDSDCQVDRARASAELHARGIARLPDLLSPAAVDEVMRWLATKPVLGPDDRACSFPELPAGTAAAPYPLETILTCPHVIDLINNASVLAIARDYLGCKPTVSSVGLRWSLSAPTRPTDVQHFHRDLGDWRSVKLFVYLTDVDMTSGPHLYVAGSHETNGQIRARPYDPAELERRYGAEALLSVTGQAGTCFIVDTYGIHAGAIPRTRPRLMLQIEYSVLPIFAYKYNPIRLDREVSVDRYVNRLQLAF